MLIKAEHITFLVLTLNLQCATSFSIIPFRIPSFPSAPSWLNNFDISRRLGNFGRPPDGSSFLSQADDGRNDATPLSAVFQNITSSIHKYKFPNPVQLSFNFTSWKEWWDENTIERSGLFVYIFPAILAQLVVLNTAFPVVLSRLLEYVPSEMLGLSVLLLNANSQKFINSLAWTSVFTGIGFMFYDTLLTGASWSPMNSGDGSYAIITGYAIFIMIL